jgi:hypothetical protein
LRADDASNEFAIFGGRVMRDVELGLQPARQVEPLVDAVELGGARYIDDGDGLAHRRLGDAIVQSGNHPRGSRGNEPVVASEQRLCSVEDGLLDYVGVENSSHLVPKLAQLIDRGCDDGFHLACIGPGRNVGQRFPGVEREQHTMRPEPMKGRLAVEHLLAILSVGTDVYIDRKPSPQAGDADGWCEMIGG